MTTTDEARNRDALIRAIRVPIKWQGGITPVGYLLDEDDAGMVAEAILAAGFRKVEVTDDMVNRGAKAIFDIRDDAYDMDEWEDLDSTERELCECQSRAALSAALGGGEKPASEVDAEARFWAGSGCAEDDRG